MLSWLFRRKPPADDPQPDPSGFKARIRAFFVAFWNWTILLAAIAAMLICARLAVGLWSSADELPDSEALMFRVLAGVAAAAAVFLAWQTWQGVRYLRHRRREKSRS